MGLGVNERLYNISAKLARYSKKKGMGFKSIKLADKLTWDEIHTYIGKKYPAMASPAKWVILKNGYSFKIPGLLHPIEIKILKNGRK
jgi:hypothetical protein